MRDPEKVRPSVDERAHESERTGEHGHRAYGLGPDVAALRFEGARRTRVLSPSAVVWPGAFDDNTRARRSARADVVLGGAGWTAPLEHRVQWNSPQMRSAYGQRSGRVGTVNP